MAETMQAGRELDARVAEKVMGWRRRFGAFEGTVWNDLAVVLLPFEPGKYPKEPKYTEAPATVTSPVLPHYSTDIAAAWEVVEKLRPRLAHRLCIDVTRQGIGVGLALDDSENPTFTADADTLPLAICLASLAALESPHAV